MSPTAADPNYKAFVQGEMIRDRQLDMIVSKAFEAAEVIIRKESDGSVEEIDCMNARLARQLLNQLLNSFEQPLLKRMTDYFEPAA